MGCGSSISKQNSEEIDLIHSVCLMIENQRPTLEKVQEKVKQLQNLSRPIWSGCWSTPLVSAVKGNRKDLVRYLVNELKVDVNACGELLVEDWCALGTAIDRQNEDMAKFLVFEMGANANLKWKKFPYILLAQAIPCQYDPNEKQIRFLVNELGVDVNLSFVSTWKGSNPITVLHHAIEMDIYWDNADWNLTRLILSLGGDPKFQTFAQWSFEEKRLVFGEGSIKGLASQHLRRELQWMKFTETKTIDEEHVKRLIDILERFERNDVSKEFLR